MPLRVVKIQLGTESGGKFTENPTAFARCVESVSARGGAYDPKSVCASAGRKKYGKKKFAKMAAAGRKRAARKNTSIRKTKKQVKKSFAKRVREYNEAIRSGRMVGALLPERKQKRNRLRGGRK